MCVAFVINTAIVHIYIYNIMHIIHTSHTYMYIYVNGLSPYYVYTLF